MGQHMLYEIFCTILYLIRNAEGYLKFNDRLWNKEQITNYLQNHLVNTIT
jgi:hypothetical protein